MITFRPIPSFAARRDLSKFRLSGPAVLAVLVLGLCLFSFNALSAAPAASPSPKRSGAVLTPSTGSIAVGPHSYITPDADGTVSLKTLSESFQYKGLKGQKQETELLTMPLSGDAFWIAFEIYNDSDVADWVMDFGNVQHGRLSLARDMAIVNLTTNRVFALTAGLKLSGLPDIADVPVPGDAFLGSSIPISLKARSLNVIAVYFKPDPGLGVSVVPRILSQKQFMASLLSGDVSTILGGLFFVVMMAVFTTFLYMTRHSAYLFLLGHFAALCALFFCLNQSFASSLFVQGPVLLGLYVASVIAALMHTRMHLRVERSDHPIENALLFILCLLCAGSAGAYLFAFDGGVTGFALFSASVILAYAGIIVVSLFLDDTMQAVTRAFCAGWLIHLIGFVILSLGVTEILPLNIYTIHAFWLAFIPQSALFVLASVRGLKHDEEVRKQNAMRQKHDDQTVARMQKSKEAADQARLLRVIERERELMSELREREIQRAEEMRHAKEIADRANMAKSAFLAVVSHEIRTPMTGIMGMVQLLQDTNMNKTQADYVDTIKKSGQTMMTLLNDILDFEKIERGSMDIEEVQFDLPRLAQDIVTLMSGHAAQKNLSLRLETAPDLPHTVWGDPTRIRQILLNLVNNGLKFTHEGGVTIRISWRKSEKGEGHPDGTTLILFSVIDSGIGISKEAQMKLFTPFTQAEASITRQYGGTGLGLAISDKLVDAMGGKIRVRSEVGKGTEFYFELPMAIEEEAVTAAEPLSDEELKTDPIRILVVEDNEMNRKVLDGLLSKYGHEVLLAANGFEAIQLCEQERPRLIFMDIQMSGMNGLDAARKIRANSNEDVARTPIIALTGNVMPDEIEEIYAAQMNGVLAKPIEARRLNEIIYNAVRGQFERPLPPKSSGDPFAALASKELGIEFDDREIYEGESVASPGKGEPEPEGGFSFDAFRKKLEADEKEEVNPLDYGADITEAAKKRKNDLNFGDDEELTEIQKFLLAQQGGAPQDSGRSAGKSGGAPAKPASGRGSDALFKTEKRTREESASPAVASVKPTPLPPARPATPERTTPMTQPATQPAPVKAEKLLDRDMLTSLVDTLGKEQFTKLLEGFLSKADEIVAQIDQVLETRDIGALAARSHELKGMAANFGMAEVSRLAGLSEKAAKTKDTEQALKHAKLLAEANTQTKTAFAAWLSSLK